MANLLDMRRTALLALGCLALLAPQAAQANVIGFHGEARIELHEFLVHGDNYSLDTTVVDVEIELTGVYRRSVAANGLGSARVTHADGSVATVPLQASMSPPEGSGGFVLATGLGDDRNLYCFRIWDQVDAPEGPRVDRLVAGVEPLDRFLTGHVAANLAALNNPSQGFPLFPVESCGGLEWNYRPPISGDFSFSTII